MNKICPECGTIIGKFAKTCSCGWGSGKSAMSEFDKIEWVRSHKEALKVQEDIATEQAQIWLEKNGVVGRNVRGQERREALVAYIKRLKTLPKPEPTAWAYEIVSRIADGESVSYAVEKMAREVVNETL